ncbi:MAG: hypothetical protein ABL925_01255 [Methylococcales bacterium]
MKIYFLSFWLAVIGIPLLNLWQGVAIPKLPAIVPPTLNKSQPPEKKDALGQILAQNLWDKQRGQIIATKQEQQQQGDENSPKVDAHWQLKGVVMPDVIYVKTDKGLKHYHKHDQLPDGALVHNILIDGIVLEKNTKKYYVYLFGKKP